MLFVEYQEEYVQNILSSGRHLLSNAVKFTPDGGRVDVTARRDNDFIEITVEDSGIGIRKKDMPRLFREFSQIESGFTKSYEGTGLGLALSKRIVELQGGWIRAESEYGRGSRFSFGLPVTKVSKG